MEKMRHMGPISYIYIYNKGETYFWPSVLFLFIFLKFSLASLFDIRKSDRQNSSGQEAKCSTR